MTRFAQLPRIQAIYCPARDCTRDRDWLLSEPTPVALWVLGTFALLLALFYLPKYQPSYYSMTHKHAARIALVFLATSLYLRASLINQPMYIASIVFNLEVGSYLCNIVISNTALLLGFQPLERRQHIAVIVARFLSLGLFATIICGSILMFHTRGTWCLQIVFIIILTLTAIVSVLFLCRFTTIRPHMTRQGILSTTLVVLMLELWAAFMLTRLLLPLDSLMRYSEMVFFLLNYVPLLISLWVVLVLGDPLSGDIDYNSLVKIEKSLMSLEDILVGMRAYAALEERRTEGGN